MNTEHDRASANPAGQSTTARERAQRAAQDEAAAAEHAEAAVAAATERATRAADAAHSAKVARLRADFMVAHPGASDADFERELPTLIAP
jgi:hypothetical protein